MLWRGDTVLLGGLELDVLHPAGLSGDSNDDSIAVQLTCGTVDVLLTGDAEAGAEAEMIAAALIGPVEVEKAGHHGSDTSRILAFVDATSPDYVVISAGRDNQFGHPIPEVVARWEASGAGVPVAVAVGVPGSSSGCWMEDHS
ncbi:MAG: hypothetical protein Kow0010_10940 [Dehalococcoidia bacterium]